MFAERNHNETRGDTGCGKSNEEELRSSEMFDLIRRGSSTSRCDRADTQALIEETDLTRYDFHAVLQHRGTPRSKSRASWIQLRVQRSYVLCEASQPNACW